MKISLIIPMYNESSIIEQAVSTFSSYMEKRFEDWELIFVDDGSADGCGEAVRAVCSARNGRTHSSLQIYAEPRKGLCRPYGCSCG